MDELLMDRTGAVLTLTLNRPEKMNALSATLVEALLEHVEQAAQSGVRLLVLRGAGRNFSAGFDFSGYEEQSQGDLVLRFIRIEQLLQAIYYAPFDTLALAHGRNFGAGVDLVCSCDHRIGDPSATFMMPGLSFGLVLGTRRYAARVGDARARRVLAGGVTFTAQEAIADGFLTQQGLVADWPEVVRQAAQSATRLSAQAQQALHHATVAKTQADDLSDLVSSAARPGLKARIQAYRG